MLVLQDQLVGTPIMSLQTGAPLGLSAEPIVDPRRLQIVAFYCEGQQIEFHPAILHTEDIREFGSLGIIVDSAESIMPPDDLVRLKEILDFQFSLEAKAVIEEDGRKLGKVTNYSVDTESFYIIKLHIKPTLLQSFNSSEFIVDRTQIKTITDDEIIVHRADIRHRTPIRTSKRAIDNPFRVRPQPEATSPGAPGKR